MQLNENFAQSIDAIDTDDHSDAVESVAAFTSRSDNPWWYRVLERLIAFVALIILAPLILILMAIVKLESRGPALFVHERVARYGRKPFKFAKLRTMYTDSPKRFPKLCAYSFSKSEVGEVKLSLQDDPRVTTFGKWLRRTSLDELPNFWHVVTGEMALVGPRPEMWKMLPYYDARTVHKFDVLPGITGYAQVRGRGDLTFDETVQLDLAYVREKSMRTDLRVLWETVNCTIAGKGAF